MGISNVYPQPNEDWVVVTTKITVNFDGLVDHNLVDSSTFVVYAPGDTLLAGPLPDIRIDKLFDDRPNEYNIITGTYTCTDYDDGYGTSYTRVEFQPDKPLKPLTTYVVVISNTLSGDSDIYSWSFITSTEHIESLPTTGKPKSVTIVVGDNLYGNAISNLSSSQFNLVSSFPKNSAYNVEVEDGTIILVFNSAIDETSVDVSKFVLSGEAADGHRDKISHGIVPIDHVRVVGNRIYLYLT